MAEWSPKGGFGAQDTHERADVWSKGARGFPYCFFATMMLHVPCSSLCHHPTPHRHKEEELLPLKPAAQPAEHHEDDEPRRVLLSGKCLIVYCRVLSGPASSLAPLLALPLWSFPIQAIHGRSLNPLSVCVCRGG